MDQKANLLNLEPVILTAAVEAEGCPIILAEGCSCGAANGCGAGGDCECGTENGGGA